MWEDNHEFSFCWTHRLAHTRHWSPSPFALGVFRWGLSLLPGACLGPLAILLPLPPDQIGLQAGNAMPSLFFETLPHQFFGLAWPWTPTFLPLLLEDSWDYMPSWNINLRKNQRAELSWVCSYFVCTRVHVWWCVIRRWLTFCSNYLWVTGAPWFHCVFKVLCVRVACVVYDRHLLMYYNNHINS
jgi:hypothetical protein